MREILFRGKRIDNGKWVKGSFMQNGEACKPASRPDLPFSDCYIFKKTSEDIIDYFGEKTVYFHTGAYHVDPATIGQYTGLTDKNGKKIFEGDIVWFLWVGKTMNFRIDFVSGEFLAVPVKQQEDVWAIRISGQGKDFEVIGNIHDNPELLEETK